MGKTSTISISDYVFEIGNQFFDLNENDWNVQDDLNYESTEREGLNGYVLKVEEKAIFFNSRAFQVIIIFFHQIKLLIKPEKVRQINTQSKTNESIHIVVSNTQTVIRDSVRSRLLATINEDLEQWQKLDKRKYLYDKQSPNSYKNQFKSVLNNHETQLKKQPNIVLNMFKLFTHSKR